VPGEVDDDDRTVAEQIVVRAKVSTGGPSRS
jgi:hypothetical protein